MRRAFSVFLEPLSIRELGVLAAAALLAGFVYLGVSQLEYRVGFPLDDSWIHQTFARNLAEHGEWSFRAGASSSGSTAPFWSALLAVGFLLNLSPYIWTYFLGILILWGLGIVGELTARRLIVNYTPRFPWVGLFLIVEWHLLWAAMSGMETLLHALLVTLVLSALMLNSRRYLTLGLLTGFSVWVRPDGLTLLAPLGLAVLLFEKDTPSRLRGLMQVLLGFSALFLFYLLFNLMVGGTPMPNTFYAKQAEYAAWQQTPILSRLGELFQQLLAGPSVLLVPGMLLWAARSVRERSWGSLLAFAWVFGYMAMYILRLPVYQHGRYIMPAMPILFLLGILAVLDFTQAKTFGRYQWFVKTLWSASLGMVSLLFVILGAIGYSQDVALIEQEMVETAKWVDANLPPDVLLAVHDIGAIGYFSEQEIIDLAGLVSPEVVPFIRDEPRLAAYLDEKGADYLIAFPDFYSGLLTGSDVVFFTQGAIAEESGFAPMTIYRLK